MAYSPSKKPRISTSSSSSTVSLASPNPSERTLSRRNSWTRPADHGLSEPVALSNPLEQIFRAEDSHKPYKYEFYSQASLGLQDTSSLDDDEAYLTAEGSESASRKQKYPASNRTSPLKQVSLSLRRLSGRVVNLGGDDQHLKLVDADERMTPGHKKTGSLASNPSPLRGTTLGIFGPTNAIRMTLYKVLLFRLTEPLILLLILVNAIILITQSARAIFIGFVADRQTYFQAWEDYVVFVLFIFYTVEAFARICVNGFILDPEIPITSLSFRHVAQRVWGALSDVRGGQRFHTIVRQIVKPFALPKTSTEVDKKLEATTSSHERRPSRQHLPFMAAIQKQHSLVSRGIPYFRHSWSRIDMIAIVGFWVTFILSTTGVEREVGTDGVLIQHIGVFRALSILRCARLLAVTNGTTTIMQSLKLARPLLAQVAYFVLFAMVLFSIIGVQSFKGSFRRECVLLPFNGTSAIPLGQQCGGFINRTTSETAGFLFSDNTSSGQYVKGFVCPSGQICQEQTSNPFNNLEAYDNFPLAVLQVVIIASANTWSPTMYQMIDAEFFISCLFFIICIVVLNFWLINLFVAVITNTFQAIRAQTKRSAFGATQSNKAIPGESDEWPSQSIRTSSLNFPRDLYRSTRLFWPLLAVISLALAASKTSHTSPKDSAILNKIELGITIAFDFEMLWRFLAYLPDWRNFGRNPTNWVDLGLAIINSVIQISPIHSSDAYPWLTVFQLARWYRVILEVPRMRSLILTVFGNSSGLVNMTVFLLITNGLAALAAVQLLRGDLDDSSNMNFSQIWISFLGMYQILSSENWTTVLYGASTMEQPTFMMWIVVIFLSGWLLFGNFILIQLFIAVINENFQVAEETKREQQVAEHLANRDITVGRFAWISKLNPYKYTKSKPKSLVVESLPSNLILPMRKAVIQDRSVLSTNNFFASADDPHNHPALNNKGGNAINILHYLFQGDSRSEDVAMSTFSYNIRNDPLSLPVDDEYYPEGLISLQPDSGFSEEIRNNLEERRAQRADFILAHPSYDKTFWVFSQKSLIRQVCQSLVEPSNGERIFGRPLSRTAHAMFQLLIFLTIVGGIVVTSIATPLYRRNFYAIHGPIRNSWFVIADGVLTFVLIVEVIIKVIADGFIFTPNAYLLSIWNLVDLVVVTGLTINSTTAFVSLDGLSRFTRSLKALRALRLITLFDKMRTTFYSLLILGFVRILDAGILAALYMIPYAVWGLNIFAGLSFTCNDTSVSGKSACRNEYLANSSPLPNGYSYLAPRVWENPITSTRWSFDTFGDSILILFEIVSLEGWIDVMSAAIDIAGRDEQPQINASQWNAIFFLIYNLLGAVVILTLFVSIIIGNFSSRSGLALLTEPQREWVDLLKLIKRQRPSKRPKVKPDGGFRAWCFDRATSKHGYWMTSLTLIYIFHILLLMTQTFSNRIFSDRSRDICFLILSFLYAMDITIKLIGLGWASFQANGWNIFDVLVVTGSIATTIPILTGSTGFVIQQLQKLFLVSIALKLVQRTDSLNQLFKTSISSLPVILSLLLLWFALFIFFGILYVEIFGLTRWESAETHNENYTSLGRALVMLAFMSTGEGWNQYMHDFAISYPRCTNSSPSDRDSDCGSPGWSYLLFISWNILSMYIFVNMFTGVVVENFSYVFQLAGGAKAVDREQMRAFKKVWAEFADQQTGRLKRGKLSPFLNKLSGVFETRIYPSNYQVHKLLASARVSEETKSVDVSPYAPDLDLRKLNQVLNTMDFGDIRRRRMLYVRLYHEACLTYEHNEGISFTEMLLLLAHNKLITDREALSVKELLIRQETTRQVLDAVNVDKVQSLLRVIHHRRRFLRLMEEKRRSQRTDIPEIIVELDHVNSQSSDTVSHPITVTTRKSLGSITDPELFRQSSDYSREEASPRYSIVLDNPQSLLLSLNNSPWGELFTEHIEQE